MRPTGILVLGWLVVCGAVLGGCGQAGSGPSGWQRVRSPRGFEVSHPQGWTVDVSSEGRVTVRGIQPATMAIIQPFQLDERQTALAWITQAPPFLDSALPKARILDIRPVETGFNDAAASITYQTRDGAGTAHLLVSTDGPAGMLYAIAAPEDQFESIRGDLVKVLSSFVFTEPSSQGSESAREMGQADETLRYVSWKDPNERAFSVEVPRGWEVNGGMFRHASVDIRPAFEVISPDRQIRITYGDAQLPPFVVPNPMLQAAGFAEGAAYSPGYGVNMMVMRYLPGEEFAQQYVTSGLAQQHPDLSVTDLRARPELVQAINALYAGAGIGIQFRLDAGEASFTFSQDGREMRGYCLAVTQLVQTPQLANWMVKDLVGCVATRGRDPQARAVLRHMMATLQVDPQWFAMQQGLAGTTSQIVNRTNQEISRIITDTYEHRQQVQDDAARRWSNAILGKTDLVDPETGDTWKVAAGHNYYWHREHTDGVVGTEISERPDIDFTPLLEW